MNEHLRISIGSGVKVGHDQARGYKCLDKIDLGLGADYIHDVRDGLPWGDNEVDEFYCRHFLEHLTPQEAIDFLNECWRCIKPDGVLRIEVPHALRNQGAFTLPHRSHYIMGTFEHLEHDEAWRVYGMRRWYAETLCDSGEEPYVVVCAVLKPLEKPQCKSC